MSSNPKSCINFAKKLKKDDKKVRQNCEQFHKRESNLTAKFGTIYIPTLSVIENLLRFLSIEKTSFSSMKVVREITNCTELSYFS